jgi:hypothetical protein
VIEKLLNWLVGPILVVGGFLAIMTVIGMMMDTAAERSEDHDRCMKHATNGYEIEKCR